MVLNNRFPSRQYWNGFFLHFPSEGVLTKQMECRALCETTCFWMDRTLSPCDSNCSHTFPVGPLHVSSAVEHYLEVITRKQPTTLTRAHAPWMSRLPSAWLTSSRNGTSQIWNFQAMFDKKYFSGFFENFRFPGHNSPKTVFKEIGPNRKIARTANVWFMTSMIKN